MTASGGGPVSVLYVDGDADLRDRVVTKLSEGEGDTDVTAAATGEAALDLFEDEQFDCVVSEYRLPDTDGLELLEQVRTVDGSLPFVLFTDSGSEAVASDAFSAGATDYLRKAGVDGLDALAAAIEDGVEEYRTQLALEESEQRYRTLVEGSHDGIYIYQDDQFVFVSDRVCEVTGYSEAELAEMEIWELVHPADRERVRAIGEQRALGEDPPKTYDARILTKDGETRYLEFSVESVTYQGEWAALGSARDVTERRKRERELRTEQEFIRTIVNTLEDVIFVCSLDGEILRWNDRLCEVTGYSDEELAEMLVFDLVAAEYEESMVDAIREVLSTGTGSVQGEALAKDGDRIPFEFRGSPLTNSDGEAIGIAGVARDVTDRRMREQELTQYRTIVEAVGDPVYTIDTDGYFTLVNEALAEMTDYTGDELVGEHVSTVMRDQDVETAEGLIEELLKSDERRNATFEMEAITKHDDRIPCEDHIALLPSEEGFRGTAGVVRDITDRKEREEMLRRQNERLDQFAGVVSHDLRNPLNVILSRLELARRTGEDEHFEAIEQAGERMVRLIEDLLTLARDGQTVGEVEPVTFQSAVESAWQNVETKEASLSYDGDVDRFLADSDRLASLLENLFRNAVEHGGGDVRVRVGAVACADDAGFYVADDGPGIPAEKREEVFQHGYTSSEDGTGLGLVIVDGIVDAHDWSVTITDSEMDGVRFEVTEVEPFER